MALASNGIANNVFTKMKSIQEKSKQAFLIFQKLVELAKIRSTTYVAVGKYLSQIRQENKFKLIMGDDKASWSAFLATPEIKGLISNEANAYRYVAIYEKYIKELGLSEKEILGLDTVSLYLCSRSYWKCEKCNKAVYNIRSLTQLKKKFKNDKCKHDWRKHSILTKENWEEWKHKIKELSRTDLKKAIKGIDEMNCAHQWEEIPAKWKCKLCGMITNICPSK
mgnify:CR=1 FL=1